MQRIKVKVSEKRLVAQGIYAYALIPAEIEGALPPFAPGSHIDIVVPGGWVRSYSLWNSGREKNTYRIGVLKVENGRGGSQAMHDTVEVGDLLEVSPPKNNFPLVDAEGSVLLLAGGIGITPLLAMAQSLIERGKPFTLHYCARSRARAAFLDRLGSPELANFVNLHFDDESLGDGLNLDEVVGNEKKYAGLYVCGPRGFMDAALDRARHHGWPESKLHFEFFQADTAVKSSDQPFELHLLSSGQVVHVAANQTAVQALVAAGVPVDTSCEQGICGTCLTVVKSGVPDHRDAFLMPEERAANNCFMPCCSRALTSSLVIDR